MIESPSRNYFGTLMLLSIPMTVLYPKVVSFVYNFPAFFKAAGEGGWRGATIWVLDSEVLAVWTFLVLAVALMRKKWFEPGYSERNRVFFPLMLLAFNAFLSFFGYNSGPVPESNFETFKKCLQVYFDMHYTYWMPLESLTAPVSSVEGFAYQPFTGPFPKGYRVSVVGCFLLVLCVIWPNFLALKQTLFAEIPEEFFSEYFKDTSGSVFLLMALLCCADNLSSTFKFNGNPSLCTKDKPHWQSFSLILAPVAFYWLFNKMKLLSHPLKGFEWLGSWNTNRNFSIGFFVMAVLAALGYSSDPKSVLGKSFRAFYRDADAEDIKEEEDCETDLVQVMPEIEV